MVACHAQLIFHCAKIAPKSAKKKRPLLHYETIYDVSGDTFRAPVVMLKLIQPACNPICDVTQIVQGTERGDSHSVKERQHIDSV